MLFNVPDDEVFEIKKSAGRGQLMQILVLLLLVAVFAYIYFFTGLIRPKPEAPKPPETVAQTVKKPMPPRLETPQPAPAAQPEKPAQPAPPAPVKEAKPAPPEAKPVAPQAPAKAAAPVKPAPPKAVAKPAPAGKVEEKKPAVAAKPERAKPAAAPKAEAKPHGKPAPVAKAEGAPSTVLVGEFVGQKAYETAAARLKKAGLAPKVAKLEKKAIMNRLQVGVYSDEASANAEVQKLQAATKDVFALPENGKYAVYAGSYANEAAAKTEKERLARQGVEVSIRKVSIAMPMYKLTLGGFKSSEAARQEARRLRKLGLPATVATGK